MYIAHTNSFAKIYYHRKIKVLIGAGFKVRASESESPNVVSVNFDPKLSGHDDLNTFSQNC